MKPSQRNLFIPILVIGFLVFGFFAFSAHAQDVMTGLKSAAGAAGLPGKPTGGFEAAIGGVIGSVMGLVGTILFVYMLYGGFKWMTAGGDNKAITDAQSIIKNAIIGIAIIIFAYTLTSYVINTLSTGVTSSPSPTGAPSGTTTTGCPSGYSCMVPDNSQNTKMVCPTALGANGCSPTQACCSPF
ncbi:MAG: hypothetical protein WC766_03055 [Patescibacteria group bacterium]|jgi:uncharacterized BrkB/YihY/UPF0761 family membrane protein